jgi:alpha-N-arabinofuranosidase
MQMRPIGHFLVFTITAVSALTSPASAQISATLDIHNDHPGPIYNRRLFGQFAEHLGSGIYGGIWVGPDSKTPNIRGYRTDVLEALKAIKVPVIRWPGGCFADEYHWREGIGPRPQRKIKINTNWGYVTENNVFGTHEFMDYSEMVGADAYVSGNVGSAPPYEMAEWVEYMTSPAGSSLAKEREQNGRQQPWKVAIFGLGNELCGCGGQMKPDYAADLTRRYSTFVKVPKGVPLDKIASGSSENDYNWTETMMREAGKAFDGIGVHYYTVPGSWQTKGSATHFDEVEYARTLAKSIKIDEYLTGHSKIMDKYDPKQRVALLLDEWGTWYDVEPGTNPGFLYQQNTVRDALVAALTLNIFAKHADRVRGANIAQMVNVLQAMLLTKDDKMVKTPTYYVFDLYKEYQDATVLPIDLRAPWYSRDQWALPSVSASAVRDQAGVVHLALVNVDPHQTATVTGRLASAAGNSVTGRVLTAERSDSFNDFGTAEAVKPVAFAGAKFSGQQLPATLPPHSVVMLDLR